MERVINDWYDDKYTRAVVVYAVEVSNALKASYNIPTATVEAKYVPSAELFELAKKGLIIATVSDGAADEYFNPVSFAPAGDNTPATVTVVDFVSSTATAVVVSAVDPE